MQRLAEGRPEALRLSELCKAAGLTIGSFYHHFDDQADFFDKLLNRWLKIDTTDVLSALAAIPEEERLEKQLGILSKVMNQKIDKGIRNFATVNRRAAEVLLEVDQLRITFMACYREHQWGLSPEEALRLSQLEYAAFVGVQMIWDEDMREKGQSLYTLFQAMADSHYKS
ncbi:MAG: TetR/AcrR family transcriptional regulator [Neomegalonema sp.]|nr:TetR/AcrR family transcriptional regulator [Neomegalonema sp.]